MKAFPTKESKWNEIAQDFITVNYTGMDLRDYFASKAMMIAIRLYDEQSMEIPYIGDDGEPMDYEEGSVGTWYPQTKKFGQDCYAIADAMMEARNESK